MICLDVEDLLYIAERVLGSPPEIRDLGLLEAAAVRPRASAFSEDAYGDVHAKAAALLHSVVRNRALADGNKRRGLAASIAFYGLNGRRLTMTNDEAYDLALAITSGAIDEVVEIAERLESMSREA